MIHQQETVSFASDLQRRLADVLDEYLRSVEVGSPLGIEELISRYPDLSEPLREYLPSLEWLQDGVAEMRHSDATIDAAGLGLAGELGDYRLLREVGRGGMGIVYEAEQLSLDRRVALKVLPFAAVLDRKQILRFQNEARAAAQLHHPNIVPVHGVGMDRGVYFYAMQFIEGRSLQEAIQELSGDSGGAIEATDHAVADRPSSTDGAPFPFSTCRVFSTDNGPRAAEHCRAVAELGIQAAQAIHTAHDCGVVHRDIKPSNLLLDGAGKLWVTDFGLARYQTDASCTASGEVLGTLHYMSPEQARGRTALIDHRTDIYSLGITLYELLTLRRPFTGETHAEIMRQIEVGQCRRVRQENKGIPRDLENIVAKSMAARREDRYSTAQDLADDLQRFLSGKPTHARPPTITQRTVKWARRHQRSVTTASIILMLSVVALLAGTIRLAQENAETQAALQQSMRSNQVANERSRVAMAYLEEARSAVDLLGSRAAELLRRTPGTENARRELLTMVIDYHNRLLESDDEFAPLRSDAAIVHAKIAGIHEQLGDHKLALREYQHAQSLWEELRAEEAQPSQYTKRLAICLNRLGLLHAKTGQHDLAAGTIRAAIKLQSELLDTGPAELLRVDLAQSWSTLGVVAAEQGKPGDATRHYRRAMALLPAKPSAIDEDAQLSHVKAMQTLANVYHNLSRLPGQDDPVRALEWSRQSLQLQQKLVTAQPDNLQLKSDLAAICNSWASLVSRQDLGVHDERVVLAYDKAARIQQDLLRKEPFNVDHRRNLAVTLNNQGMALNRLEAHEEAKAVFRRAIKLQRRVAHDLPSDLTCSSQLGGMYNNLAMVYHERGDNQRAARAYVAAIHAQKSAFEAAPHVARFRDFLSRTYVNYGRLLRQLNQPRQAMEVALRRRELWPTDALALYAIAEEIALACQLWAHENEQSTRATDELFATLQLAIHAGWRPPRSFHLGIVAETLNDDRRFQQLELAPPTADVRDARRD